MTRIGVSTLLCIALSLPHQAIGQAVISGPTCSDCRLELTPVVTLGDPSGPGMLETDFSNVRTDSRGRFHLFSSLPYFWVFGPDGEVIARPGRQGQGPGEFTGVTGIVPGPADSLFVFDGMQRRAAVLSPSLEYVRTIRLPGVVSGNGRFVDGALLLNEALRTGRGISQPLHLLDRDGEARASFGAQDLPDDPSIARETLEMREVAPVGDGTFWVARINEYLIERWNTSGQLLESFRREVDWFPRWTVPESDAETPPVPFLKGLHLRGDTLFVLAQIPGANWADGVRPTERWYEVVDPDVYRNTMIEAIDLRTRRVIAASVFSEQIYGFTSEGLVWDSEMDASGNPVVRVRGIRVRQRD